MRHSERSEESGEVGHKIRAVVGPLMRDANLGDGVTTPPQTLRFAPAKVRIHGPLSATRAGYGL
jgi:hypothetical protein